MPHRDKTFKLPIITIHREVADGGNDRLMGFIIDVSNYGQGPNMVTVDGDCYFKEVSFQGMVIYEQVDNAVPDHQCDLLGRNATFEQVHIKFPSMSGRHLCKRGVLNEQVLFMKHGIPLKHVDEPDDDELEAMTIDISSTKRA